MQDFLPPNTFQGDLQSLSFLLLLKRLQCKTDLILNTTQHYQLDTEKSEQQYTEDELQFYLNVGCLLSLTPPSTSSGTS